MKSSSKPISKSGKDAYSRLMRLMRLIEAAFVRVRNLRASNSKGWDAFLLTPMGAADKAALAAGCMQEHSGWPSQR